MRTVWIAALVAPLVSLAQTPVATPSGAMETWHSDTLRLSYSYPSSFVDASALVGTAMQAGLGDSPEAQCIHLPLARMGAGKGSAASGVVVLARADAGCMKKQFTARSVREMTEGEVKGLTAAGAKGTFGTPDDFTVAGRPASAVKGSFTLPTGQHMRAMVVCVLDQPDIACWQFISPSADGLAAMTTFPVTFDGQPAASLVPAGPK